MYANIYILLGYLSNIMGVKNIKVDDETNDLLDECKDLFIKHYPEMSKVTISKNKIIHRIALAYLNRL